MSAAEIEPAGSGAAVPALALGALALCGVGAFLLFGGKFVSGTESALVHGLGAALGLGAASLAVAAILTCRRRRPAETGFIALHMCSAAPAALSDGEGRLLLSNAAFNEAARSGARSGRAVGVALGELIGDAAAGGALAYRLANGALRDGAALERWPRAEGGAVAVRAERVGPRMHGEGPHRLVWTLVNTPAPAATGHMGARYGYARRGASGAILAANEAFNAMPEAARAAALEAFEAARADERLYAEAELAGAGRALIAGLAEAGGATELLIFPAATLSGTRDSLFEDAPVALALLRADGAIEAANAAAAALLGPEAGPGAHFADLVEGLGRPIGARIAEAVSGLGAGRADLARASRRDRDLYLQIAMKPVAAVEADGAILAVISDATDMEAKERQFVQSQKMQAVGQLAGGVAHDFNNLLTAILGHCDLLSMRRDETDPDFSDLTQIRQNANRAAALVRQLLAFSRQQKLDPQACQLTDVLGELSHLLNRLIGERVTLDVACDETLWPVWIDQQQFEQVILNLVVNARDAMPDGGQVRLICRNETLREELKRDRAVAPVGDYVRIEIADEGAGMSDETRAKVFEPFFTTKRPGEGTGLGLSTAYGIVKQTGGFIFVDSALGKGTVFTLLIPRLVGEADAPAGRPRAVEALDLTGAGRILLVEDEAPVRAFVGRALRLRGYDVLEAEHAEAALALLEDGGLRVDLVISDVVMPGLDGPAWVREARRARPDVPVIFTSGYSGDMFRKGMTELENCSFLAKPFSLEDLGAAVKTRLPAPSMERAPPPGRDLAPLAGTA